jgi:hypothetical protein
MKTNYQTTIMYKALVCLNVRANNEEEAKSLSIELMKKGRSRLCSRDIELQDDNFKVNGILNMDETWNQI